MDSIQENEIIVSNANSTPADIKIIKHFINCKKFKSLNPFRKIMILTIFEDQLSQNWIDSFIRKKIKYDWDKFIEDHEDILESPLIKKVSENMLRANEKNEFYQKNTNDLDDLLNKINQNYSLKSIQKELFELSLVISHMVVPKEFNLDDIKDFELNIERYDITVISEFFGDLKLNSWNRVHEKKKLTITLDQWHKIREIVAITQENIRKNIREIVEDENKKHGRPVQRYSKVISMMR